MTTLKEETPFVEAVFGKLPKGLRYKMWVLAWQHRFEALFSLPVMIRLHFASKGKMPVHIVHAQMQRHSWFEGDEIACIWYFDMMGRMWSRATGVLKPTTKTIKIGKMEWVDLLGGQSWKVKNGLAVCEYRTNEKEARKAWTQTSPTPSMEL